jgi:hypothetical protein
MADGGKGRLPLYNQAVVQQFKILFRLKRPKTVFQCSRPGVDCGKKHEKMLGLVFFQTDKLPGRRIAVMD